MGAVAACIADQIRETSRRALGLTGIMYSAPTETDSDVPSRRIAAAISSSSSEISVLYRFLGAFALRKV